MESHLLQSTAEGLYCAAGDFYVDPWLPVERAIITHGHSDHARAGSRHYLTAAAGEKVIRARLGPDANIDTIPYGHPVDHNGVLITLYPAGHVLGSSQVRLEYRGQTWVVSGDYKLQEDKTCATFEPVRCHLFLTESTFGLPIYRWQTPSEIFEEINAWWRLNQTHGRASVLYCYALGKAQRVLGGIDATIGPIFTHGAVERINEAYRASSVSLPTTTHARAAPADKDWSRALILAPPSAHGTPWTRKFAPLSTALASGWMRVRGVRRRRAVDRGFVLSDHVDWPGLKQAIEASGADQVWVTHGYVDIVVRWLQEHGVAAKTIPTQFKGEVEDEPTLQET